MCQESQQELWKCVSKKIKENVQISADSSSLFIFLSNKLSGLVGLLIAGQTMTLIFTDAVTHYFADKNIAHEL